MSIIFKKNKIDFFYKRKKNIFSYFVKKKNTNTKVNKRVIKHKVKTTLQTLSIIIIFIVITSVISLALYFAFKFTANVKQQSWNTIQIENVIGLNELPTYPNSEYVFKNIDNEYVRKFTSLGRSIYRLPPKTTLQDLYDYYYSKLFDLGWEYIDTVPLESEDKRFGQYWIKDGKGLRIYNKFNDVWYEIITEHEARTGLSDSVKKENELKLLLLTREYQELRPDYPWKLSVPSEYLISYYPSSFGNLLSVRMNKMNSKEYIDIIPIGYTNAKEFDLQIDDYLKEYNKKNKVNIKVLSSIVSVVDDQEAIKVSLINNEEYMEGYVTLNKRNNVNYLILSSNTKNPLLNYIVENIKHVRTSYNESE